MECPQTRSFALILIFYLVSHFHFKTVGSQQMIEPISVRTITGTHVAQSVIEILEAILRESEASSMSQSSSFLRRLGAFYDKEVPEFIKANPGLSQKLSTPVPVQPRSPSTSTTPAPAEIVRLPRTRQNSRSLRMEVKDKLNKESRSLGRELQVEIQGGTLVLRDGQGREIQTAKPFVRSVDIPPDDRIPLNYPIPDHLKMYPAFIDQNPAYRLYYLLDKPFSGPPNDLMAVYSNIQTRSFYGMTRDFKIFQLSEEQAKPFDKVPYVSPTPKRVSRSLPSIAPTSSPLSSSSGQSSSSLSLLKPRKRGKRAINQETIVDTEIFSVTEVMKFLDSKDCLTQDVKLCKFGKLASEIVSCNFRSCQGDDKQNVTVCIRTITKTDDFCYSVFIAILLNVAHPGYLQPTFKHLQDNSPKFTRSSLLPLLDDTMSQGSLQTDKMFKCFSKEKSMPTGGNCFTLIPGDFNSVYSTFRTYFSNKTETANSFVFTKNTEFWNCDNKEPVWKDAETYISVTDSYDSWFYDLGRIGEPGFEMKKDCIFMICDVCVKPVPALLKGNCQSKWNIDGTNHYVELCNKEQYSIGYVVQPIHNGPRFSVEKTFESRFVVTGLYAYLRNKLYPDALALEFPKSYGTSKGLLPPSKCHKVAVADASTSWIYYYVKCGEKLTYHHETLNLDYRCRIKSSDSYWPWFYDFNCTNWHWIRFVYVLILLLGLICLFNKIYVTKAAKWLLCWIVSPLSYLLFRYFPYSCKKCFYPWSPWHKCPDECVCQYKWGSVGKHNCVLAKYKQKNDLEASIKKIGKIDDMTPTKVKGQLKLLKKRIDDFKNSFKNSYFDYQFFSTIRNPYTNYTASFVYVLIIYIVLCLVMPTAIATCIECTSECSWNGRMYVDSCENPSQSCFCAIGYKCRGKEGVLFSLSSTGESKKEKDLKTFDGCFNLTASSLSKYEVEFIFYSFLKNDPCLATKFNDDIAQKTYLFRLLRGLPMPERFMLISGDHPKVCSEFLLWLESASDYKEQVTQKIASIVPDRLQPNMARNPRIQGLRTEVDLDSKSQEIDKVENLTRAIMSSVSTLQDSVEEQANEDLAKKKSQLQSDLTQILTLFRYNGSIFGRDHTVIYPGPPPYHESVYSAIQGEGHITLDMSMPARAGTATAFKPVYQGTEIPILITLAVPETAGVYEMLYQYTTCKTRVIEVIRYDKCVGQCSDCFNLLKSDVKKDPNERDKWGDFSRATSLHFDSPNNWACEGNGCWTINTGCLCAYCRNVPDPEDCYDIYKLKYKTSKALLCMGINTEHQCEQFQIGENIQRSGKVEIQLQGSDEWSSLIKTESVALHRGTGKMLMGTMASLGEATGDFGTPQYDYYLNLTYKEDDVSASYNCHQQIDQEVVATSCFKDTFIMSKDLLEAPSYIRDSKKKLLYHLNSLIGTYRLVLSLPVNKISWIFSDPRIQILTSSCVGCFRCLKGAQCTAKIDSSISGLVGMKVEGGVIRVSTINLVKGIRQYRFTVDYEVKSPKSVLHVFNPKNEADYFSKSISASLSEGNSPRTTVRNASSVDVNILGSNDNTWSRFTSGVAKYNPISYIGSWFGHNLLHWAFYIVLYVLIIALIAAFLYYLFVYFFGKALVKATVHEKSS